MSSSVTAGRDRLEPLQASWRGPAEGTGELHGQVPASCAATFRSLDWASSVCAGWPGSRLATQMISSSDFLPNGYCLRPGTTVSLARAKRGGFRMTTPVREGDLLWTPSAARVANARLTAITSWLAAERGLRFDDLHTLWR